MRLYTDFMSTQRQISVDESDRLSYDVTVSMVTSSTRSGRLLVTSLTPCLPSVGDVTDAVCYSTSTIIIYCYDNICFYDNKEKNRMKMMMMTIMTTTTIVLLMMMMIMTTMITMMMIMLMMMMTMMI